MKIHGQVVGRLRTTSSVVVQSLLITVNMTWTNPYSGGKMPKMPKR